MAIPITLLLTPDGELDLTAGLRWTRTLKEYTTQKLRSRLRFFLGEWFLDQRLGVPYFEQVFIENPDISLLTTLYRRIIIGTVGVGAIEKLNLRFDRKARTLFVTFTVRLVGSPETIDFVDEPFVLKSVLP